MRVTVMEKVFHFDSPVPVYKADACVITCFDARYEQAIRKFLKRQGIFTYDQVKIPGSAKALAAPDTEADRDFVLRMVATSMRLHAPDRALLIGHNDCGAYPNTPPEVVAADLEEAVRVLKAAQPTLVIEAFFADFDGIYQVC